MLENGLFSIFRTERKEDAAQIPVRRPSATNHGVEGMIDNDTDVASDRAA